MKNWKTTLFGALGALGTYLAGLTDPAWLSLIGQILAGVGMLGVGVAAKDSTTRGV